MLSRTCVIMCMCGILIGCGDDQTMTETTTEPLTTDPVDSGSTTSNSLPTSEATTIDDSTTGGVPTVCADPTYPIPGAPFGVFGPSVSDVIAVDVCGGLNPSLEVLTISVYRPEPLPQVPLPIALLTNGAGQFANGYEHILKPLAERGFVAFAVQSEGEVLARAEVLACVLRWIRRDWLIDNSVLSSCDVVLMGHSRGGEAAWQVGNNMAQIPWSDINLSDGVDVTLKALVGIAPRMFNSSSYNPSHAVPYLGMMGATDDDIPHDGVRAYDDMVRESQREGVDPAKLFLWPYDVPHGAFGGGGPVVVPMGSPLAESDYRAKGSALASVFVLSFLDVFFLGDEGAYKVFTGEEVPVELTPGGDTSWWSYLEPAFTEFGGQPVVLRDFVVDQRMEPGVRSVIDDFEGGVKFITAMEQVVTGSQIALAAETMVGGPHRGNVMRVRWGGDEPGGDVKWMLNGGAPVDLAVHSFFSLRIGQELVLDGDPLCGLEVGDPRADAVELVVKLEDDNGVISEVVLGPIVQQSSQWVGFCAAANFMPTLRIPMRSFCFSGFDIGAVVSVSVGFPSLAHETGVYIDTLEFTSATLDAGGVCP